MPYPEIFVVRLLICIAGMFALLMAAQFVMNVIIFHDDFEIHAIDIIVPLALGIVEAFVCKPKQKQ